MTPQALFRLLKQYVLWLVLIPALTTGMVAYLTWNEAKVYRSQATLYTGLASGYSVLGQQTGDRSAVAFDNILTLFALQETQRQIGVSLLAEHLLASGSNPMALSEAGLEQLNRELPAEWRRSLVQSYPASQLHHVLDSLSRTKEDNPVKSLLLKSDSYYAIPLLDKKLKATRRNTNDMLALEYETDDPAVAQQTLTYAISVLKKRYTDLKTAETDSVLNYYDEKAKRAKRHLDEAERNLQSFAVGNGVVSFEDEAQSATTSRELLLSEYNEELMRNEAAKAAMDALSQRMKRRTNPVASTSELKRKQDELTQAQNELINARGYGGENLLTQQAKVDQLSEELKALVVKQYAAGNSSDGIPQQMLVNEWLAKVMAYEESSARLKQYSGRLNQQQSKTARLTPLSGQLRQLNRKLTDAEKDYQASVERLNEALTHRRDVTTEGTLTILDAPSFPQAPLPSKRWLLIAAGLGAGLFLALLLIAVRVWMDRRVDSPEKAEQITGKPVAAVFPVAHTISPATQAGRATLGMFNQLSTAINIDITRASVRAYPPVITVFSIHPQQGKSWLIDGLAQLYAEANQRIAYLYPQPQRGEAIRSRNGVTYIPYALRPDFMNVLRPEHLLDDERTFMVMNYDKVIIELPALLSSAIPVSLVGQSAVSLLVVDAELPWGRTEKQLLDMYMRMTTHPVLTVLNRAGDEYFNAFKRSGKSLWAKRSSADSESRRIASPPPTHDNAGVNRYYVSPCIPMSNKRKAIDGGKWITVSTVIATLCQFVQISVLAKLLEPASFGLVSISTLIINFFHIFGDLGFSNSIIYKQESDKKTLSTLYILSLLLGLTAFLVIRLCLPFVIDYYDEPRLDAIVKTSSLYFIIIFFGQTYSFLLQKELQFRTIALIEMTSTLIGTTVSITLALHGFREMSLIYGGLVMHTLLTVLRITFGCRLFVPRLYFNLNVIKDHLRFGVYNVGDGLLGFAQGNMDNLFIGGLLGVKALGFYTVAAQLAIFPITKLNPIILQVAYPVLARMKENNQALKRSYLQILDLVSYLNLPLLAGLFVTADSVVPLLYGKGWEFSIDFVRIFVFSSFCSALCHPLFTLAFTKGKPKLLFYLNLGTICIKIPLLYTFAHLWGPIGVSLSLLLTMVIILVLNFRIVHSLIGPFFGEFLANITKPVLFCLIMAGAVSAYKLFLTHADLYTTLIQIALGGLVYTTLTLLFKMPYVKLKAHLSDLRVARS